MDAVSLGPHPLVKSSTPSMRAMRMGRMGLASMGMGRVMRISWAKVGAMFLV